MLKDIFFVIYRNSCSDPYNFCSLSSPKVVVFKNKDKINDIKYIRETLISEINKYGDCKLIDFQVLEYIYFSDLNKLINSSFGYYEKINYIYKFN